MTTSSNSDRKKAPKNSIEEQALQFLKYPEINLQVKVKSGDKSSLKIPQSATATRDSSLKVYLVDGATEPEKDSSTGSKDHTPVAGLPYFHAEAGELAQNGLIWFWGLGDINKLEANSLAEQFMALADKLINNSEEVSLVMSPGLLTKIEPRKVADLLVTAFAVKLYPVDLLKTKAAAARLKLKQINVLLAPSEKDQFALGAEWALKTANHINATRQLQHLPGNVATPENIEKHCREMAKKYKLKIKVFKKADLEKMGAGGILAVGAGSHREPRMIMLEYIPEKKDKNTPTLTLVGKGVTFDTGGISIKPSADMHEMKYDMSGASVTLHAVAAAAELKLNTHVVGFAGLVENMPGGAAFKPGDVYRSLKGHTIEVLNTDAEGRLVLGDVLYHAEKTTKPDLMLDFATLTGACVVALGYRYAGVFSREKETTEIIEKAAEYSQEPVWPLPLGSHHKEELKSTISDYTNLGQRWGGSSSAAAFLSLFVEEDTPWAHFDIAGVGMPKKGFGVYPAEGSGYGIRLLMQIAQTLKKKK